MISANSILLKQILLEGSIEHKTKILSCKDIKETHVYCKIHRIPSQSYGSLIENYMISKYGYSKNSASNCNGDLTKGDETYELKVSMGGKTFDKFNFVQIRPTHSCDFYILTAYYLTESNVNDEGELYIFRLNKHNMIELLKKHGQYAHGTIKEYGSKNQVDYSTTKIEFAVRTKINDKCWNYLLSYRISENEL